MEHSEKTGCGDIFMRGALERTILIKIQNKEVYESCDMAEKTEEINVNQRITQCVSVTDNTLRI